MGNKRKHDSSAQKIRNKIRKLEEKLAKKSRRQILYSSSSEENLENETPRAESPYIVQAQIHNDQRSPSCSPLPEMPTAPSSPPEPLTAPPSPPKTPAPSSDAPVPPASPLLPPAPAPAKKNLIPDSAMPSTSSDAPTVPVDPELDEDILLLLGEAPNSDPPLGPPLHKDVASRWQEILLKGLSKEVKDKFSKEYLPPSNVPLLEAPILNPEAKAGITESMINRDAALCARQKQLAVALSALASATKLILENETSKQKILKPLSDACRILCDSHFIETKFRRKYILSQINTSVKETLGDSPRDKFLFGENVSEKLKNAKTIQKSGEALKNVPKTPFQKSNFLSKNKNLNFKPQHRKTANKPAYQNREPARPSQSRAARAPQRSTTTRTTSSSRTLRSPRRSSYRK